MTGGSRNKRKSGKGLRNGGSHHLSEPLSPEWVIQIKNNLERRLPYNSSSSWSIYRVPNNLCQIYSNAFLPKMISIGPLHYRDKEERLQLQVMEEHKKRFLFRLLGGESERGRRGEDDWTMTDGESEEDNYSPLTANFVCLDDLAQDMQELEQQTRACYAERFDNICSDRFVKMMVHDGCFVVELLRLYSRHVLKKTTGGATGHDPIFTTTWMLRALQRDLLMLENQLPFFVIEKLYMRIKGINQNNWKQKLHARDELLDLAVTFFNPLFPRGDAVFKLSARKRYTHLLDVFRSTFLQSVRKKFDLWGRPRDKLPWNPNSCLSALVRERQLIHFVSELQEAGVQFKKQEDLDLLDIKFAGGTLGIPPLSIDDNTVPLFLNFIAYEQCDDHAKPFFTNYFMFWDGLVDSSRDIDILHKHGIINHALGSNVEVANLLNKLCRELIYDLDWCYLYNEIKEVNNYCKRYDESKCHVWWRKLIHEHFSSPWTCLSLFAAILLLLLTTLQTLYTVYPYYQPSP